MIVHFLFYLLSDELLGMCSHFIGFIATDENRNFLLDHTGLRQNIIQISVTQKQKSYLTFFLVIRKQKEENCKCSECIIVAILTLKPKGNLVRTPQHPQQTQCQLLVARIRPVWAEDENDQEHQQDEPA